MKKILLLVWKALFALTLKAFSQTGPEKPPQDTLVIHLGGNNHVYLLGKPLKDMTRYTQADSIKNLFLDDFEKAYPAETRTEAPAVIHYLVHGSGKRRMKVGNEAYTEESFDLEQEKKRLDLNLPDLEYILYDLAAGIEMHCYLESVAQLMLLDEVQLTEALRKSALNRPAIRRNYKLDLSFENNHWQVVERKKQRKVELLVSPGYAVVLLGSKWGQAISTDLSLMVVPEHRRMRYRFTLGWNQYMLADFQEGQFTNIYFPTSYDVKLAFTSNKSTKARWAGFQYGFFNDYDREYQNATELHRRQKFGVFFEGFGPLRYSLDFIGLDQNRTVYMTTIKLLF